MHDYRMHDTAKLPQSLRPLYIALVDFHQAATVDDKDVF